MTTKNVLKNHFKKIILDSRLYMNKTDYREQLILVIKVKFNKKFILYDAFKIALTSRRGEWIDRI